MARRSNRNRRRVQPHDAAPSQAPVNGNNTNGNHANGNGNGASSANGERYEKYLPVWMKGMNGAPVRQPRIRRPRQQRPTGGYTPGKFALDGSERF